jgi:hypothetical protein
LRALLEHAVEPLGHAADVAPDPLDKNAETLLDLDHVAIGHEPERRRLAVVGELFLDTLELDLQALRQDRSRMRRLLRCLGRSLGLGDAVRIARPECQDRDDRADRRDQQRPR